MIGHTSCGAIRGAIDNVELGNLTTLLNKIRPAVESTLAGIQPKGTVDSKLVDRVAKANILLAMRQIRERSPILRDMIESEQIGLVGGMYNLSTGKVTFYED